MTITIYTILFYNKKFIVLNHYVPIFILCVFGHTIQLLCMEKHKRTLDSIRSYKQYRRIGNYLDESETLTCTVAHLSKDGINPSSLKEPYYILHLDLLQRLVAKYPAIKSLTPDEFVEQSFRLAYEFVYNEKAPSQPTAGTKLMTLRGFHTCLNRIIIQRKTELDACKHHHTK